jgi:small subunit ribosomal protein S17
MTEEIRTDRKTLQGWVVSDKMDKTRVVEVHSKKRHTLYEKVLPQTTKLYVHDEKNESHNGDQVRVMQTRPLSKLKRWRLVEVLGKGNK